MDEKTDNVLVLDVLSGNVHAFRELVIRYQKPVYNLVVRMLNDDEEAKDITQDVFVRAYNKLDQFDLKHKFFSWVYRIALNETINYMKTRKHQESLDESIEETIADTADSPDIEDKLVRLREAVNHLKLNYRSIVILKYYNGLSYEEISVVCKIPVKKVKSRLFMARMQLKERLVNH